MKNQATSRVTRISQLRRICGLCSLYVEYLPL
jgi:hypothetical protein